MTKPSRPQVLSPLGKRGSGGKALRKAVFLDRDGVIVRSLVRDGKSYAPRTMRDFRLLPGVRNALLSLDRAGFLLIVVTNQPDIGNGLMSAETLDVMHARLRRDLPLDAIEVCPHKQTAGCRCRKPKPGLLRAAGRRYGIDFRRSFMIGDRCGDIVAGPKVGCYTVFIDRGYDACQTTAPDHVAGSLPGAARHILSFTRSRSPTPKP